VRRVAAAIALASALACASPARADEPGAPPESPESLPMRASAVGLDKASVVIGLSYRDALDARIVARLTTGLPTVVALRGYVFRDGEPTPIALTAKSCRVVYDLWEEVFRLQILQPGRVLETTALNVEGVLRQCGEAQRLHVADRSQMREGARHFVAAIVEVNPMSPETLETIRRWVTRPSKSTAIGPGDSLFGSFVGLFVARVRTAERRIAFRTASFLPPKPPPPPPPPPKSRPAPGASAPRGKEAS
jgi:hypothetical protein